MHSYRIFLGMCAFMIALAHFGSVGCQKGASKGRLGAVAGNAVSSVSVGKGSAGGGEVGGAGGIGGYGGLGGTGGIGGTGGGFGGFGGFGGIGGTGGTGGVGGGFGGFGGSGGAGGGQGGGVPVAMTKWSTAAMYGGEKKANAMTVDSQGNIIMLGSAKGSVGFPPKMPVQNQGEWDVWLVKFDSMGNCLWVQGFGDPADDLGYSVTVDTQDNIIIGGSFTDDIKIGSGATLTSGGSEDAFIA